MHGAAGLAVAVEVLQRALGVAVLPAVQPGLFAALQERGDSLRRVPLGHVLAEELVEVRVAVDRVAADDEARYLVLAELDRRQPRLGLGRFGLGGRFVGFRAGGAEAGGQASSLLQEIAARRRRLLVGVHDRFSQGTAMGSGNRSRMYHTARRR